MNSEELSGSPSTVDPLFPDTLSLASDSAAAPSVAHQQVRINHVNRSCLLALLGLAFSTQVWDANKGIGTGASPLPSMMVWWVAMMVACYIWPHLAYWRASTARRPMRTEKGNFLFETCVASMFAAVLGFPVWLSTVLFICNGLNFVVFDGLSVGLPRFLKAVGLGTALVWAPGLLIPGLSPYLHLPLHPATNGPTTLICAATLTIYIMLFALATHRGLLALRHKNRELRKQCAEIQALQMELREQALRDPLTGLYNRRHLNDVLAPMLARCETEGKQLALLVVDIDHFKRINDTHGHAAGDAVLQTLARLMLCSIRAQDLAFRHGGEEFVLLLPDASLAVAQQRAENLRAACERASIRLDSGQQACRVTLSCGVALFPAHARRAPELMACADAALYTVKQTGRNNVMAYSLAAPA